MLPRAYRMRSTRDFARLYRFGRTVRGSLLTLRFLYTPSTLKVGVVVPVRVARRAVDRNKIKRHIREAVRANLSALPRSHLFVCTPTSSHTIAHATIRDIEKEFLQLLNRVNLVSSTRRTST